MAISGCSSNIQVTKTATAEYKATEPDQVQILMTKPDKPYVEIATVTATDQKPKETAKLHKELRAKAAALGANAVILTDTGIDEDKRMWANGVAVRWN